jgi:hypothetical protein
MNLSKSWLIIQILILILTFQTPSHAQDHLFNQPSRLTILKTAFDQLYNFDFDNAQKTIEEIRLAYPDHPAVLIFDCLLIYWKNFPITANPIANSSYKALLIKTQDKTKAFYKKDENDPESIFYMLFVNILQARSYAAEDHMWDAAGYALNAYRLIKKSFNLQDQFNEFYFSSGLYKYYREYLPEQNSTIKPIAWTLRFPAGDKTKGLEYLDKAGTHAIIVAPEALLFSTAINLKYENNITKALSYAIIMKNRYPNNLFFTVNYIETLLQLGAYDKAATCLEEFSVSTNNYYKLPYALFKGILEERYYKRLGDAEKWYMEAIKTPENWDTQNYIGLAFYGLGNIYRQRKDNDKMKKYYRKAYSLCEYISVKNATNNY